MTEEENRNKNNLINVNANLSVELWIQSLNSVKGVKLKFPQSIYYYHTVDFCLFVVTPQSLK